MASSNREDDPITAEEAEIATSMLIFVDDDGNTYRVAFDVATQTGVFVEYNGSLDGKIIIPVTNQAIGEGFRRTPGDGGAE